jgi:hypothetical protein
MTRAIAGNILNGSRAVPALAAGTTHNGTVSVTLPANTPLNIYYLIACADNLNNVIRLATTLAEQRERVLLFRELATLRADAPIGADVDALRWRGPRVEFAAWSNRLGTPAFHERASKLAAASPG